MLDACSVCVLLLCLHLISLWLLEQVPADLGRNVCQSISPPSSSPGQRSAPHVRKQYVWIFSDLLIDRMGSGP